LKSLFKNRNALVEVLIFSDSSPASLANAAPNFLRKPEEIEDEEIIVRKKENLKGRKKIKEAMQPSFTDSNICTSRLSSYTDLDDETVVGGEERHGNPTPGSSVTPPASPHSSTARDPQTSPGRRKLMPPEPLNGTLCATVVRHCRVADLGNLWEDDVASGP
jgi:hypothetical protein